jgi:hypothetical protein
MTHKIFLMAMRAFGVFFALAILLGLMSLNANAQRQLQTLREHPTAKAKPQSATASAPPAGVLVGSCTLEDGTEVDVYTVVKQ